MCLFNSLLSIIDNLCDDERYPFTIRTNSLWIKNCVKYTRHRNGTSRLKQTKMILLGRSIHFLLNFLLPLPHNLARKPCPFIFWPAQLL